MDGDHIEAGLDPALGGGFEIVQGNHGDLALFSRRDRAFGISVTPGGAGLDLHEHEGVTVSGDDVNLTEQTLAVYDNRELVFATVIASGLEPFWTKPGTFQIFQKKETETMRNNDPSDFYYLDNVPWTMYFDGARAIHGAYWRTRFGYPQSHGCVNLSAGDSHWLFNWATEGDWVHVHDPSGLTPTDPNLYPNYAY